MHKRLLPYVEQLVQENEEREKTTDELLPQHNYLKNLNDGTLSMQEIVMSTLDVLLAGIRNVSHKNVFGKQLPILLPTRTVKLLLPILL